jgi:hypothetical protein
MRFVVFVAVKMVIIFWVVICELVDRYQHFEEISCLYHNFDCEATVVVAVVIITIFIIFFFCGLALLNSEPMGSMLGGKFCGFAEYTTSFSRKAFLHEVITL